MIMFYAQSLVLKTNNWLVYVYIYDVDILV